MLLSVFNSLFAQDESAYYYYQAKKFFVTHTYQKVVVGLKQATSFTAAKNNVFAVLKIKMDSVKPTSTLNQFAVGFSEDEHDAAKTTAAAMLKNPLVAYVHPCLVGGGGKLVSYGDAFTARLKTGIPMLQLNNLLSKYHCSVIKTSRGDKNTFLISAGAANNYDALKMANLFFESALFDFAEPDFTTYGGLIDAPNDPLYYLQWAHHNTGSPEQYGGTPGADMQVDSAWLITKGDSSIKIAVIDTGVDTAQVDLKENLLQGYDCITQTANPGDGAPKNLSNAHGTACAGIIGSLANNNIGTAGIAPKCRIIPININSEFNNFASDFAIAGGIDYAWQNGADVLTNSWVLGLPTGSIDAAIHRAATQGRGGKGCILFFGAGNDNAGISYPAYNPEVIAVGGSNMRNMHKTPTSNDGEYWWGASYGNGLDLVGPCVRIPTADISGINGYNTAEGPDGDYNLTFNGTSAATPHAAAVAALVLSYDKTFSGAEVRNIIESSCTQPADYIFTLTPGNLNGTWNNEMGYGVVNAYKSLQTAKKKKFCNAGIVQPASTLLCKNASIKLSVVDTTVTASFTWRLNGVNTDTGKSIIASTPGTYDVIATLANGCTAYTAGVTLYAADTAALQADAGPTIFLCPGSTGAFIGGTPSAKGGSLRQAVQRAYGYDLLHASFIRFNIENPRDYKYISVGTKDGVSNTNFYVGDFTPRGYYAINNYGELARIDTATGYTRLIGYPQTKNGQNLSHKWTGLTWDPVTQKLYGVTSGGLANSIYEIDLVTGKSTWLQNLAANLTWAAYNSNGNLFGFNSNYNKVMRVTGPGNTFFAPGLDITLQAQLDGSFDPLNGKLYMTTYGFGQGLFGDLREFDTTGGMAVKGGIGSVSEVGALAISPGAYTYSWAPATGLSNSKDANPIAKPGETTTYTLTVTDACGAKATSSVVVNANIPKPPVVIKATSDYICVGDSSRLTVTKDPNYRYEWLYNNTALTVPDDTAYTATRGGKFQVTVTKGPGGCSNTAKFTLKDCSIYLKDGATETTCNSFLYPPYGPIDTGFKPNQMFIKTIYPATEGSRLQVTFRRFYTAGISNLTVYDGPNQQSLTLKEFSYYDNDDTATHTYASSTGPLTFALWTGSNEYDIGTWDAFLSCFTPKVYRTKQDGNFEAATTWQVKTGDNIYEDATEPPTYAQDSIIIQNGHTITLNSYFKNVDELWVQKGAKLILNGALQLRNSGRFSMIADGDITINNNGALYGACPIIVRGNITSTRSVNGMQPSIYAMGTEPQTFTLASVSLSALHVMNPVGVTVKGRIFSIDSLFMNCTGGLQLDSVLIRTRLILDSGIIHIKSPGVMELSGSHLQYSSGNAKSYVDGAVSLSTYSALAMPYPTGTAVSFRPLTFQFEKYVNDTYTVQALEQPAPALPLPPGIDRVSTISYYSVKALRKYAFSNVAVTIPYLSGDGVTDPANLRIVRDSASKWWDAGGVGTHADTGTITSTQKIASLGNLALANATGGTNTLPVTWLHFTATVQNKNVQLQWAVANETNCAYYTAEHSKDGMHFTPLAETPAYKNNSSTNIYSYLHKNPVEGKNYYRIKETDRDERYMYSKVIAIQVDAEGSYLITPNPTRGTVTITAADVIKEIDCYNAIGQLVKKIMPASTQYKLSMKQLAAGVYTIRIITTNGVHNAKVVKE